MNILTVVERMDCGLLHWTRVQRRRRIVLPAARILSRTGDGFLPILTALVGFYSDDPVLRQLAWQLTTLFLLERVLYLILKNLLKRQRPADADLNFTAEIVASDKFSFPSGHTSAAVLYAALVCFHFPLIGIGLFLWAAGVGVSRVVLGVHYPTDILAGATLGLCIAAAG